MKFFSMLIKSYSISPVLLQRIMEKALFLQFFFFFFLGGGGSIDHLFGNLESGRSLNFGSKTLYKPCIL